MKNLNPHSVDWNNLNLESPFQRSLNLIDPLTIETFLLEIECNLENINEKTVRKQFEEDLQSRIKEARAVLETNLANLVQYTNNYRKNLS